MKHDSQNPLLKSEGTNFLSRLVATVFYEPPPMNLDERQDRKHLGTDLTGRPTMSETNRTQITGSVDDLRDRIIASLADAVVNGSLRYGAGGKVQVEFDIRPFADAVIEELREIRCWKCDNTVHVTDWEADDE